MTGQVLGYGKHRAYIRASPTADGTGPTICQLESVKQLQWQRSLSKITQAKIKLVGNRCCDEIAKLRAVEHELVIERNGNEIWTGPVVVIRRRRGEAEIVAFDRLWWAARRWLTGAMLNGQTEDVGQVVRLIMSDAFEECDIGMLANMLVGDTGFYVDADIDFDDYSTAFDQLLQWAEVAADWTMYGPEFRAGLTVPAGVGREVSRLPRLTSSHIIGNPTMTDRGDLYATHIAYKGNADTDGNPTLAVVSVEDLGYDPVPCHLESHLTLADDAINDPTQLREAALEELALRYPVPTELDMGASARLSPKAPVCVEQLIAGAIGEVSLPELCPARDDTQQMVLTDITGTVTAASNGTVTEAVAVKMEPATGKYLEAIAA